MLYADLAIIGAGPVGLFSIFQAGMLGMKCVVIDAYEHIGGQCTALYPEKPIYDIPAYPEISGANLINHLKAQASPFNPHYFLGQQVISLEKQNELFILKTSKNNIIKTKAVIIAGGCGSFGFKKADIANIESYENKSVFYSVIDPKIFKDKDIVITGGGDSAIDWTLNLSKIARKIYLVHRRSKFRCMPHSLDQVNELQKNGIVEKVIPYQLSSLEGDESGQISNVILSDLDGNLKKIKSDFLLCFYGLAMDLGPIREWGLNMSHHTINVEHAHYETNIAGIYAVGDIASYEGKLKLILTGFAEAASAIHHAYPRVFGGKSLHFQYSTTTGVVIS
jgi:thioredoxin reductase (NADPH)